MRPPDDEKAAARRRRRLAALGESLPVAPGNERDESRGDDVRDGSTTSTDGRDDDIRAEVPPHHD